MHIFPPLFIKNDMHGSIAMSHTLNYKLLDHALFF